MGITLLECTKVVGEIKAALTGGLIQKIHQPQPFLLTFDIRIPGKSFSLLLSVEPQFARIHLSTQKLENPQAPYGFCQYLRSHLDGGRIESLDQEPEDRIVYLTIHKSAKKYILVIALTGNQSNIFVLNEERAILRSLKPSKFEVGVRYVPPPRPNHSSSPLPLTTPLTGERTSGQQPFPISLELEKRFSHKVATRRKLEWYKIRSTQLNKALKQTTKREKTLEADLMKAEKYREYQRYGELLKSQLHTLQPRQSIIEVVDYYDPTLPTLTLPLNELKDPVWNMEDYFRKYRKYLSAQEHLQPRLEKARSEIHAIKEELVQLEKDELVALVDMPTHTTHHNSESTVPLYPQADQPKHIKGKRQKTSQTTSINLLGKSLQGQTGKSPSLAKHYRTFESFDGLSIFVGKSAKDNDFLTLKIAKPDDVWLHARGCPGSHVVVRLDKATELPHETLRDAATLALFYSDLKKSGKGEVIHTLRKFVKKSKGLKAGAVHVTREKSIWIELKKDRLDRLKGGI